MSYIWRELDRKNSRGNAAGGIFPLASLLASLRASTGLAPLPRRSPAEGRGLSLLLPRANVSALALMMATGSLATPARADSGACTVSGTATLTECSGSAATVSIAPGTGAVTIDGLNTTAVYVGSPTTSGVYDETVTLSGNTVLNNPNYSAVVMQFGTSGDPPSVIDVTVNATVNIGADVQATSIGGFGTVWVRNDNAGSIVINNAGTLIGTAAPNGGAAIDGATNLGSVTMTNSGSVTSTDSRGIYADGNYRGATDGTPQTVSVTNTASGVVNAYKAGIRVIDYYGLAQLTNEGTVNATLQQGLVAWSADGDALITNSGHVTSGNDNAVYVMSETGTATLVNSGTVTASGDQTLDAAHAALSGGIQGMNGLRAGAGTSGDVNVTNTATGVVTSNRDAGIRAETPTGTVTVVNAGSVTGYDGIVVNSGFGTGRTDATVPTIAGAASVTNTGTVDASNVAVQIDATANSLVNSGTLTTTGAVAVTMGDGNTSIVNSGTISAGSVTDTAIQFGNGTNRLVLTDASTVVGLVQGGSGNDTLELERNAASTFDLGQLGSGGQFRGFDDLDKTGTGTLNLTGTSSFSGATKVSEGELKVNGSIANSVVTILSGATLSGAGTVGGVVATVGSTIAPGNSPGTLTVAGDYYQASGSTYAAQLVPGSATSDRIAVGGTATIENGAILDLARYGSGAYALDAHYTLLTATGGVTGNYVLTGDTAISAFYAMAANYDANDVYLDASQTRSFASAAMTPNQFATAGGLQSLATGNVLRDATGYLQTDAEAQAAFNSLSGEIHSFIKEAMVEDSRFVRNAAIDRVRSAFSAVGAPPIATKTYGRLAVWSNGYGAWDRADGNGNAASLSHNVGGFVAGADAPVFDIARFGLLAGYARSTYVVDESGSSGASDNYTFGAYGGTQLGALGFRLGSAYTWSDVTTSRRVGFSGFADSLSGKYDTGTFQAFGDVGYRIDAGPVSFEPFAGLAYVNVKANRFTEQGGLSSLTGQSSDSGVTFSTLGLRGSTNFDVGEYTLTASGSFGWRHAFGDTTLTTTLNFAGSDPFGIGGAPIVKDVALIDLGLSTNLASNIALGVSYTGQFGNGTAGQGVSGNLNVKF